MLVQWRSYITGCFITAALLLFNSSAFAHVKIQEFKTKQNLPVLLVQDNSTELTTVYFVFKGMGAAVDPHGKEGLGAILTESIFEQSKPGFDRYSLDKRLRSLGILGGISSNIDSDDILFSLKVPSSKLKEVFAIVKGILIDPQFDQKELDKMKNFDPPSARLATAGEVDFAGKILFQKLFGKHPYSNPPYGTLDGRQSITLSDLQAAAKTRFTKDALIFSVIGNIAPETLSMLIDDTFEKLPNKSTIAAAAAVKIQACSEAILVPKDSPQSGVVFGQPGLSRQDPDHLAMVILNNILGGKPFTSRLWLEVREKRGLVYGLRTQLIHWRNASLLTGQFETDNQKVQEVIQLVREEWKRIKEQGVTEAEFAASKKGLLGGFVLNFTAPQGIAEYLLVTHLAGLPTDYINQRNALLEKVALEDVNRVAKKYLDPNNLCFVVVGNPSKN